MPIDVNINLNNVRPCLRKLSAESIQDALRPYWGEMDTLALRRRIDDTARETVLHWEQRAPVITDFYYEISDFLGKLGVVDDERIF
jgi:hypothetical protein